MTVIAQLRPLRVAHSFAHARPHVGSRPPHCGALYQRPGQCSPWSYVMVGAIAFE